MNDRDFIAGKHGISHAVITAGVIAVGTLIGGVYGNVLAAGLALILYYVREVRQHDSMCPGDWNVDGQQDLTAPAIVVVINLIAVALWSA